MVTDWQQGESARIEEYQRLTRHFLTRFRHVVETVRSKDSPLEVLVEVGPGGGESTKQIRQIINPRLIIAAENDPIRYEELISNTNATKSAAADVAELVLDRKASGLYAVNTAAEKLLLPSHSLDGWLYVNCIHLTKEETARKLAIATKPGGIGGFNGGYFKWHTPKHAESFYGSWMMAAYRNVLNRIGKQQFDKAEKSRLVNEQPLASYVNTFKNLGFTLIEKRKIVGVWGADLFKKMGDDLEFLIGIFGGRGYKGRPTNEHLAILREELQSAAHSAWEKYVNRRIEENNGAVHTGVERVWRHAILQKKEVTAAYAQKAS